MPVYGKRGPVALTFIRNNTRKRSEADESDPKPHNGAFQGMSDDNKALFNSLTHFITKHVEDKIEIHLQNVNKKLDSLPLSVAKSQPQTAVTIVEPDAGSIVEYNADEKRTPEIEVSIVGPDAGEPEWNALKLQDSLEKTIEAAEVNDVGNRSPKPKIQFQNSEPVPENPDVVTPLSPSAFTSSSAEVSPNFLRASTSNALLASLEHAEEEAAEVKESVKIDRLKEALEKTESLQEFEATSGVLTRQISYFVEDMSTHKKDTILDVVMAMVILLNSIVIGISMDHDDPAIDIIDLLFTICFVIELFCKFYLHGVIYYFAHFSNVFDLLIIAVDIFQLVLEWTDVDLLSNAPAASMFRVARLVRLVRLIRLARLNMLDDLVALISGMVGGMSTLMWSIVLFFLILYITALLFREFFGQSSYIMPYSDGEEDLIYYFATVPRCMLTVFRFFFGDFSTVTGLNIFEGIQRCYGSVASVLVCVFFFMITIGLFNVIAAIFVESTLAAANHAQIVRKTERMNDEILWATRLTLLVRKIFEYNHNTLPDKMSQILDSISDQAIPEAVFQEYMTDPAVTKALRDLEIEESDHKYLFDILDNDNTGSIFISQLSDGLERLRGDPRRSDIVCVDLMVRSIQQQTDFLVQAAKANVKSSTGNKKKMDENQSLLHRIEDMLMQLTSHVIKGEVMTCGESTFMM